MLFNVTHHSTMFIPTRIWNSYVGKNYDGFVNWPIIIFSNKLDEKSWTKKQNIDEKGRPAKNWDSGILDPEEHFLKSID